MRKPRLGKKEKPVTAAVLGKYLKQLAALHRDPLLGNSSLNRALLDVAHVFIEAKSLSPVKAAERFVAEDKSIREPSGGKANYQPAFEWSDDFEFVDLSAGDVRRILGDENLTRSDLALLGVERFGIPRSRLERLPRDEITSAIEAALRHEESLTIISEEAKRGGQGRSS